MSPTSVTLVSGEIIGEIVKAEPEDVSETPREPTPAASKRKRKQSNPKHISEISRLSEDPLSPPEPKPAKKSRKEGKEEAQKIESEKYLQFAKRCAKALKKAPKPVVPYVLDLYRKQLEDPDIIKAYLLPAFHFLDSYQITVTGVFEFETICVQTPDLFDKLDRLSKLTGDLALPDDVMETFANKYSKKYWKVPRKDYKKIKEILQEKGTCTATLVDIEINEFENKMDDGHQMVTCLTPKMKYD